MTLKAERYFHRIIGKTFPAESISETKAGIEDTACLVKAWSLEWCRKAGHMG